MSKFNSYTIKKRTLSNTYFYGLFFIILLMLSVKHKIINYPAIRPFYTTGLILLCIMPIRYGILNESIYKKSFFLLSRFHQLLIAFICAFILCYSIISGGRETKDFLYFFYWYYMISITIANRIVIDDYAKNTLRYFLYTITVFAVVASLSGILTFFDLVPDMLSKHFALEQMAWADNRIHGFMGDPTSLGGLIGIAIFSTHIYKKHYNISTYWVLIAFLTFSLIWSGSRNGIVSVAFSILTYNLVGKEKRKSEYYILIAYVILILMISNIFGRCNLLPQTLDRKDISLQLLYRDDPSLQNTNSRLYIWNNALLLCFTGSVKDLMIGHGSGAMRELHGTAFNTPLELIYDYGFIFFYIYLLTICYSLYLSYRKYIVTHNDIYRTAFSLIVFFFVFNFFISWFPSWFFNFPILALIFAMTIISLPVKISAIKSEPV